MELDEWGEPVHLSEMLAIPAKRRLEMERDQLLEIIAAQRDHIERGTKSADPDSPQEILRWAEERLEIVDARLRELAE